MSRTINYKEKYEKALKAIGELLDKGDREGLTITAYRKEFEEIFSELAESEDERIIKEIIQSIKGSMIVIHKDKCLAWLEKVDKDNKFLKSIKVGDILTKSPDGILINLGQSDRALEHHNKVEPKFKIGDWICNCDGLRSPLRIISVSNTEYMVEDVQGNSGVPKVDYLDKHYHLWSIEDAKEGDILANNNVICVYKERVSEHLIKVIINYSIKEDVETHYDIIGDSDLYPATKAQRDFFIRKI